MMAFKERNLEDARFLYLDERLQTSSSEERSTFRKSPRQVPPDICYPEFRNIDINIPTSSPIAFQQPSNYFEPSVYVGQWDQGVFDKFDYRERCADLYMQDYQREDIKTASEAMEETFRQALLQYFSQVDQEKEGLADDLKKLKDDFDKYVAEGRKHKSENIQQAKIIRKLTENGKLFVQEIERLKIALKQTDEQRSRLLSENVHLRKKVLYEEDIIPHLEHELKSLAEENNFLKLLAEDTKQLEEQEIQIQGYANHIHEQQHNLNVYAHEVQNLTNHMHGLSQVNSELNAHIKELEKYKSEVEVLRKNEKLLDEKTKENHNLLRENKQHENEINNLHAAINELQKDLSELKNSSSNLSKKYMQQQETTKEKNNRISELKEKLNDLELLKQKSQEKINFQENQIRELAETVHHLEDDNRSIVDEISQLKMENDAMTCEDEIRSKDYENLIKKLEIIENQFNDLSKKERQNEIDINEKNHYIENFNKKEEDMKDKIQRLQTENNVLTEKCYRLELKCSHLQNREEELEQEILVQVKTNSELEQDITLVNKTLDTLKKSNDSCVNQRANLQKEVLLLQQEVNRLEVSEKNVLSREKIVSEEMKNNEEKLIQSEDQKARLQKEILQIQDRLCKTEDDIKEYREYREKFESMVKENTQLKEENENLHGEVIYFKDQNKLLTFDIQESEELKIKLDQYENEAADLKFHLTKTESRAKHLENEAENHKHIRNKNFDLQNEILHLKEENMDLLRRTESLEFENKKLSEFKKLLKGCKTEKLLLLEENLILKEKVFNQVTNTPDSTEYQNFAPDVDDILKNKALLEERLDIFHEENISLKEDIITLKESLAAKDIIEMKNQNNYLNLMNQNEALKLEIEELRTENIKLIEEIQCRFRIKKENEKRSSKYANGDSLDRNVFAEGKATSESLNTHQSIQGLKSENIHLKNTLRDLHKALDDLGKGDVSKVVKNRELIDTLKQYSREQQSTKVKSKPSYQILNDQMSSRDSLSTLAHVSLQGDDSEKDPLLAQSMDDLINFDSADKSLHNSSFTETDVRSENDTIIENTEKNDTNKHLEGSGSSKLISNKSELNRDNMIHPINSDIKKQFVEDSNSVPVTFSKDENSFLCSSDIVEQKVGDSEWKTSRDSARPLKRDNSTQCSHIADVNKFSSVNGDVESNLFENESKPMNSIIYNLEEENENLHEDIDNLLKDYQSLKNNLKRCEKDLHDREKEIEDLVDTLENKDGIIRDLQTHLSDIQKEFDDGNAIEFKELVSQKNSQIAQLQVDNSKLEENIRTKQDHIDGLKQELNYFKDLETANKDDLRSHLKLPLPQQTIKKTQVKGFLKLPSPGAENQNRVHQQYGARANQENVALSELDELPVICSFSNSHLTTDKAHIEDIKEDLQKKDNLIKELEVFIKELQEGINQNNSITDSMNTSPVKKQVKFQLSLSLPKPEKNLQKSNLPSIPIRKKFPENPTLSPDISPGEVDMSKMSREFRNSPGDVRKKMMSLNSELLQKKIDINKLEDELKITKRNQIRAEESYRNITLKNDALEQELLDTKRKIKEIQTKQSLNDMVDKEKRREIQNHKMGIDALERKCGLLIDENTNLLNKISQKEKTIQNLQDSCESLNLENIQLKNTTEMLDGDIQNLSATKEKYEFEINNLKEELMNVELSLKKSENENKSLKTRSRLSFTNLNDLKSENNMVTQNLLDFSEENDKLKTTLNICENERNIYELNLKEKDNIIEDLRENLRETSEENLLLKKDMNHLENVVHRSNSNKRNIISETSMVDTSVRHLQDKIEELRENLLEKEELIFQLKKERNAGDANINRCNINLNHRSMEIKTLQDRLESETDKYEKLEKLNDEMNEENKKLMHEILILRENLDNSNEQTGKDKEKLIKLEKEQKNLDNIVLKTQKSNGELLEANQSLDRENLQLRNNVDQIMQQLNTKHHELEKLDRKQQMMEEELSQANRCLINENKELIDELNVARNAINDFEGILDQGQMDFDELESQLESYRKENIDLDQRLHELLKNEMKLQSEKESLERRLENMNNDYIGLREQNQQYQFENKKFKNTCEETEIKNQEYKTRDKYYEERLKGLESIIKTKEELIQNDKNEKDKLQNNVLNLQSELIALKNINEKLQNEKENTKNDNIVKRNEIEHLEKSSLNLSSEKEDLMMQLNEKTKLLNEIDEKLKNASQERDHFESSLENTERRLTEIENELENERMKYHQERETFLVEISTLKRRMTEFNVDVEKQQYRQQSQENEIKELQETKEQLEKEILQRDNNNEKEKQAILEAMNKMKLKLQMIEQDKQNEMEQLKAEMEVYEESRNQDVSLLKVKLKEAEELKQIINKEHNMSMRKDNEIESLKEDIMQLQSHIDSLEMENDELKQKLKQTNSKYLSLEKDNHNYQLENNHLLNDIETKEERIKMFEEQRNIEKNEKQNIRSEKEKLERSYDILIEEKDLNSHKLENEIRSLRTQLKSMDIIKEENEKLKLDVESFMNERRGYQGKSVELTQLRAENFDLRNKAERAQENFNEVRNLRQELRDKEARYAEAMDKLRRENAILKRQNDELFKQNQDLELRNANIFRTKPKHTLYFETGQRADPAFLMRQRSQSQENIDDTGLEGDNFSPTRNAVATSTPTQETNRFSSSVVSKPPTFQQKLPTFEASTYSVKDPKSELSGRPSIRQIAEQAGLIQQNDQQMKEDAPNWIQSNENVPLSSSIKLNPFLQKDMSAKQTWKASVKAVASPTKTTDTPTTPKPSLVSRSSFDMRPRSSDVSTENLNTGKQSPSKSLNVGSEFVNRLKAAFETK